MAVRAIPTQRTCGQRLSALLPSAGSWFRCAISNSWRPSMNSFVRVNCNSGARGPVRPRSWQRVVHGRRAGPRETGISQKTVPICREVLDCAGRPAATALWRGPGRAKAVSRRTCRRSPGRWREVHGLDVRPHFGTFLCPGTGVRRSARVTPGPPAILILAVGPGSVSTL
jgi:hypothetical protein